jgi:hypothetical protein
MQQRKFDLETFFEKEYVQQKSSFKKLTKNLYKIKLSANISIKFCLFIFTSTFCKQKNVKVLALFANFKARRE